MKRILIPSLFLLFSFYAFSQMKIPIPLEHLKNLKNEHPQSILDLPKTSNYTRLMFLELKRIGWTEAQTDFVIPDSVASKFFLAKHGNEYFANSFIVLNDTTDYTFLKEYNIEIGSRSRNILIGFIPLKQFSSLSANPNIKYIEIGTPAEEKLDNARSLTNVNQVHQGMSLPQAYDGSGVIVGVIDKGIDFTHPTFYNDGLTATRIKRVWEQTISGTPPAGYNYGRELTSASAIVNAQTDNSSEIHGTHTTGIAAGSGYGTSGTYRGIAPLSDIALVASNFQNTGIANGVDYIFNYASSQSKSAVVNMSIGAHYGPHDGTSTFDQFCDGIVGSGKILVGAASNEGDNKIHFYKPFSAIDTSGFSFAWFPSTSLGSNGSGGFEFWSNPNYPFIVAVNIFNLSTNQYEDWTPYILVNSTGTYSYTLHDADTFFPDACSVTIETEVSPLNNKPHATITIDNTAQDDAYRMVLFEMYSYGSYIDGWCEHSEYEFWDGSLGYPVIDGDTTLTVAEIGGTGNRIVSVGSYNSTGTPVGGISFFSSIGPTADGRIKPDITAPGNRITSSVNSFDTVYLPGGTKWNDVVTGIGNTWYYGKDQGTSMASPVVAGIVALWLQAYPYLTPEQAKTLLKNSAIHDSYTGTIPTGSNTWGWGKANAWLGMQQLLSNIPAKPVITGNSSLCQGQSITLSAPSGYSAYQWSTGATTQNISVSSAGSYTVRITNSQGYISPWSDPKVVTVNQLTSQPGTISGNTTVCQGSSQTYSISSVSGATSYTWALPSGWSGSSTSNSITATVGSSGGTISVTANNGCGSSTPRTLIVSVSALPLQPSSISGNTTVCQGTSQTYSISSVSGTTSYTWTLPSGWSGSSTSNSITTTVGSSGGTVSVTANNGCGSSALRTLLATVSVIPNTPTFFPQSGCSPVTVTATSNNCTGCSYNWSTGSTNSTSMFTTNTNFTVTATNVYNCSVINSGTVTITGQPSVSIVPSVTSFCTDSTATLSTNPTGTSYAWSGPNGFTSSAAQAIVSIGGSYSVTVTNPGSCTGTATATTNIIQYPATNANAGNNVSIQQDSSTTLTATGGTIYSWSNGANTASTTVTPATTTTYTVTVTDGNSCSATAHVTVTVIVPTTCNSVYHLSDSIVNVPASGGNCSTNLTTDVACSWSVNAGGCIGWVTKNTLSGFGDSLISFTVDTNTLPSPRTCVANIQGQFFQIIQAPATVTDIQNISAIQNIFIYPNPNTGTFIVSIESAINQKIKLNVFNSLGQLISMKEIITGTILSQTEFNLAANAKGIYYVQILSQQQQQYFKVVIE